MITNDNNPPDKDSPYWSATNTISTNVIGEIYGWVRAIDNVGNATVEGTRYGVVTGGDEPPVIEDEEELLNKYLILICQIQNQEARKMKVLEGI